MGQKGDDPRHVSIFKVHLVINIRDNIFILHVFYSAETEMKKFGKDTMHKERLPESHTHIKSGAGKNI